MATFGTLLAERLAQVRLSQRAFAAATRTPLSTINAVIGGTRKPPKRRLAQWAMTLHLTGSERDRFLVDGFLCHAPAEIAAAVERLRAVDVPGRRAADPQTDYLS